MLRSVDEARKRELNQGFRIVFRLDQRGQQLFADALQLFNRESRSKCHVGHDWKRVAQARDRHMKLDIRRVGRARRRETRAEVVNRVGNLQRVSVARAFVQHLGCQAGESELAARIGSRTRLDDKRDVDDRNLVQLDDPHR